MDHLLQRELYRICFPLTRKQFWLISKTTRNLGQKPTTFVLTSYEFYVNSPGFKPVITLDGNHVFNLQGTFSTDVKICFPIFHRFIEFNHQIIFQDWRGAPFIPVPLDQPTLNVFFHSGIRTAFIDCQLDAIFDLMPNLKYLEYFGKLSKGWEKHFAKSEVQIDEVLMCGKKIDYKTIYNFIIHQKSDSSFRICHPKVSFKPKSKRKLKNYFEFLGRLYRGKDGPFLVLNCDYYRPVARNNQTILKEEFDEEVPSIAAKIQSWVSANLSCFQNL